VLDTRPEAERRYFQLLQSQAPHERLRTALCLSRTVRQLAIAGIRDANPGASECDVQRELARRLYGAAVATRLFGE
jgi:hypothetical protein